VAEELSEYVYSISMDNVPSRIIDRVKLLFLDWLGCCIIGSGDKRYREYAEILDGRGRATIIGLWMKSTPINSGFTNSVFSHVYELDDVHMGGIIHIGSVVFPSALAICEEYCLSGREFIEASIAGYEAGIRIAMAMGRRHYRYWHTTGTCGSIASAVASSKALGLEPDKIASSIGIAGTFTSGLWEYINYGSALKPLVPGHATLTGIMSSLLASRGLTGPKSIFEGDRGLFKALQGAGRPEDILMDLGSYQLENVSIKLYPVCRHIHSAIDLILKIRGSIELRRVKEIKVKTYSEALRIAGLRRPRNIYEARFSMSHCIAAALKYGSLNNRVLQESLVDESVHRIEEMMEISIDRGMDRIYSRQPVEIEVYMDDGSIVREYYDTPRGDPSKPLGWRDVESKFKDLARGIISSEAMDKLINLVKGIDRVECIDILDAVSK